MISGGGTGGHVYPALAVTDWLTTDHSQPLAVCWVGSAGGPEEALVTRAGLPFERVSAAKIRGKHPVAVAAACWALARGYRQARRIVARFRPEVLFVTGGYVCWPVTFAAWRAGVPVLIYLPDVEPGLAIKSLARFARQIAVTQAASLRFFRPGQASVTGYPVRAALFQRDRQEARRQLGLPVESAPGRDLPVLLVFGGSQGAHSINQAVTGGLVALLSAAHVVHVTGQRDAEAIRAQRSALPEELQRRYYVYDYLDAEMVDALVASDLAVARAGASTLGELPAAGLPGVLVPYPYAGAHQWANARLLADAGAAVIITDAELPATLVPTVLGLLADTQRRTAMGQASRALARPEAAAEIGGWLYRLAATGQRGEHYERAKN